MRRTCATLLAVAAVSVGAAAWQQSPPPAPAQPPTQQMPAMSEDKRVQAENIDTVMAKGDVVMLDVRDPKEIDELGGYEGAINIPLPELERRLGELPKDKRILTT
jgi:3-mercaptopyruvate sulfurtransferase SseA